MRGSSTAILERQATVRYHSASTDGIHTEYREDGTAYITGMRIFREGTFADSRGDRNTWEPTHLEQMVFHFGLLGPEGAGLFIDVPFREDHTHSVKALVGFIRALRHEGIFLVADVELTEPDAVAKWKRGTYKTRSLEVGMYDTNDEALYWPVVMGCAFVPIGAVEGLYTKADGTTENAIVNFDQHEEITTMTEAEFLAACAYATWLDAVTYAQALADFESACSYATAIDAHSANAIALGLVGVTVHHVAAGQTASFSIGGVVTSDPNAIQGFINRAELFAGDVQKNNRTAFVAALATDNKIVHGQKESLTAHALSLSDVQYDAFVAMYSAAPKIGLFGVHGGKQEPGDPVATKAKELKDVEDIIAEHRRAKMPEDALKATATYQRYLVLTGATA